MSAAVKFLRLAIEDAVLQLEPQLLPLFGSGRNAREHSPRPTVRTQVALKMLVALTRFFPEEHRVRKAGRQLEMIWPPLVHEPRGAAAGKLLQHYFRLRQDLLDTPDLALRRAMRELVRGAIDAAQVSRDEARIHASELKLRQLASFLSDPGVDVLQLARVSPLARLFVWQQALELPLGEATVQEAIKATLLPDMLAVLDRCTALCRASDWSIDYYCNSGLARALWHLRGLARFCCGSGGEGALADLFDELEDDCLDMHLAGSPPRASAMHQWLVRLFQVVHERNIARPVAADNSSAPELPYRAVYDQELANYRRQLQAELQAALAGAVPDGDKTSELRPLKVTAPLITLLYKLTWVFAAAEQHDWARLCHCAYRVALQYWRIRRPVTEACLAVLLNLAAKPGTLVPGSVLRHERWLLMQDWPRWTDDTQRPIALRTDADHVVALEAVPDLLSGSFTALVQAGRLTDLPNAQACRPHFLVLVQDLASELLQELALLEKGAAAMQVWPLEQLCTLLIGVYEAHLRDEAALPAELLQNAHRQLVRMLDQAAAWHEVKMSGELVQALEQWLGASRDAQPACREPRGVSVRSTSDIGTSEEALRAQLLSCLGTLASVLDRPVRLHLDGGKLQLDSNRTTQVLDCLRPLIKYLLLDQSVDARTRHAMHKPRISTLSVTLRAASATLIITVGEDSHEEVLAAAELQRLQRRMPKEAGTLVCEARAGHGRSFTFTLN